MKKTVLFLVFCVAVFCIAAQKTFTVFGKVFNLEFWQNDESTVHNYAQIGWDATNNIGGMSLFSVDDDVCLSAEVIDDGSGDGYGKMSMYDNGNVYATFDVDQSYHSFLNNGLFLRGTDGDIAGSIVTGDTETDGGVGLITLYDEDGNITLTIYGATGTIRSNGNIQAGVDTGATFYSSSTNPGITKTVYVKDGTSGECCLTFESGIIVASDCSTCP